MCWRQHVLWRGGNDGVSGEDGVDGIDDEEVALAQVLYQDQQRLADADTTRRVGGRETVFFPTV